MIIEDEGLGLARHLGLAGVLAPWVAALLVAAWGWFTCHETDKRIREAGSSCLETSASGGKA